MRSLLHMIATQPLLWLLAAVPAVLVLEHTGTGGPTLLFSLSVLAIVPLAALLSHATESVAARTGDAVGGLLNATLGNLTELVIAFTALKAGQHMLVKASIAGAIVTNSLFMLGGAFLLGGLKHKVQSFDASNAKLQAALLFMATIALLVPSTVSHADGEAKAAWVQELSVALSVLLIVVYALGLFFSLGSHKALFGAAGHDAHAAGAEGGGAGGGRGAAAHGPEDGHVWPLPLALGVLGGVTVLVALVSEIFVGSVEHASTSLGLSPAFVGFVLVSIVGAAAEIASAFSAARKDRLNLSIGIALGSSTQIALFVAPVLVLASYVVGSTPLDLQFWPGAIVMMLFAALTASTATASGRSAWFVGVLLLSVYAVFALALYLRPS
jgi:Ca2+:H+ antiporter